MSIDGFNYTTIEVGSTRYRPGVGGGGSPVLLLHGFRGSTSSAGTSSATTAAGGSPTAWLSIILTRSSASRSSTC
jgi:hypothetical protein